MSIVFGTCFALSQFQTAFVAFKGIVESVAGISNLFLRSINRGDPLVYQLTGVVITAGETYVMAVDAWATWIATDIKLSMYYDNAGDRVEIASTMVDISGGKVLGKLKYIADNGPAEAIGMNLGIEFLNASASKTWAGLDRVQLVPEPATLVLRGLGGLSMLRRRK